MPVRPHHADDTTLEVSDGVAAQLAQQLRDRGFIDVGRRTTEGRDDVGDGHQVWDRVGR